MSILKLGEFDVGQKICWVQTNLDMVEDLVDISSSLSQDMVWGMIWDVIYRMQGS